MIELNFDVLPPKATKNKLKCHRLKMNTYLWIKTHTHTYTCLISQSECFFQHYLLIKKSSQFSYQFQTTNADDEVCGILLIILNSIYLEIQQLLVSCCAIYK